jgi:hypothetical protein
VGGASITTASYRYPPPAACRLGRLAGDQHVGQPRRDRRREVHQAEPGQRDSRAAHVVEHLQVVEERAFRVDGQRVHVAAVVAAVVRLAGPDGDLAFLVRQRRPVEEPGDALPPLRLHQQHLAAAVREGEGEARGDGRLAGAALARHDVQPHAVPVGVPRCHARVAPFSCLSYPRLSPAGDRNVLLRAALTWCGLKIQLSRTGAAASPGDWFLRSGCGAD